MSSCLKGLPFRIKIFYQPLCCLQQWPHTLHYWLLLDSGQNCLLTVVVCILALIATGCITLWSLVVKQCATNRIFLWYRMRWIEYYARKIGNKCKRRGWRLFEGNVQGFFGRSEQNHTQTCQYFGRKRNNQNLFFSRKFFSSPPRFFLLSFVPSPPPVRPTEFVSYHWLISSVGVKRVCVEQYLHFTIRLHAVVI